MISLHRRSASGEFYRGRLQAMKADFKQINVRQSKSRSRSPQGEIDETEVNEIIPLDQAWSKSLQNSEIASFTPNSLANHSIIPTYRGKMIDWMIEVTLRFKCPRGVFYLSVKIMDKFFKRNQQALTSPLLHIIGLCCLFIASKFLDCRHRIRLAALQERIAHNKFSSFEIRMTEKLILKKLGFQINLTTCHDFLEGLIEKFKIPKIIAVIADIICKISQIYYEHLEFKPSLIAISALVISSKSVKQHMLAERIQKHQNVDKIVEQISFDVDNFVYKYPDFISIFEFHQVTITSNRPGPLFIFNERELDQDQNRLINNPNCL